MKNTKLAEQFLDIREKVRRLEEHPDEQAIRELTKLIQESKTLSYRYIIWKNAKAKMEKACEKLNEAERMALDYYHDKKGAAFKNPKIVFDTFLEGLRKMLA